MPTSINDPIPGRSRAPEITAGADKRARLSAAAAMVIALRISHRDSIHIVHQRSAAEALSCSPRVPGRTDHSAPRRSTAASLVDIRECNAVTARRNTFPVDPHDAPRRIINIVVFSNLQRLNEVAPPVTTRSAARKRVADEAPAVCADQQFPELAGLDHHADASIAPVD